MLAAPSRKAIQTLAGGPGRSPAAITSHKISSAGAIAAVPMTVGRDSSRSIWWAGMPFFRAIRPGKVATATASSRPRLVPDRGAGLAQQPRQMFFSRAFIRASSALIVSTYFPSAFDAGTSPAPHVGLAMAGGHRRGLVVAGQPRRGIGHQFAFTALGEGGLGQRQIAATMAMNFI